MFFSKKKKVEKQNDDFGRVLAVAETYAAKNSELEAEYAFGELAFACYGLGRKVTPDEAARLAAVTEKLIKQHGRADIAWSDYADMCAVHIPLTMLWRKYPEKFNLNDHGAIEKIDALTPPDIARLTVVSESGRYMIGAADDVGLHPRAQYNMKTERVTFVVDDEVGSRADIEKHVNATYPLDASGGFALKRENFMYNLNKRAIFSHFMDKADEFFAVTQQSQTPRNPPQPSSP